MEDFTKNYGDGRPSFAQTIIDSSADYRGRRTSEKFDEPSSPDIKFDVQKSEKLEIAKGAENTNRKEILFNGRYYDVTDWIERHPGGDIINFYTEEGEDATQAIQQFHHRSIKRVTGIMQSFKSRPANLHEKNLSPKEAETQKRHDDLTQDFEALFKELESEGLFKPSLLHVALRIAECTAYGLMGMALAQIDNMFCQILAAVCLTLLSARTGWLQHEGGHHSLTGYPMIDRFIQAGAFGIGSGLSSSWFSVHHQKHHSMPQRYEKDADLETLPLLAFNKKIGLNSDNSKGFFLQNQALLFFVIDTFVIGLYWKFYLHPMHALKHRRFEQFFFMGIHYTCAYYIGFWPVLAAAWFGSILLMGNISLSHLHFPLVQDRLHWVEYALVHTTDIEPSWWCDWWMGYLNYQIEHHLFPTMPQYKNYLIRDRVKALAAKHNIPYYCCNYREAVTNCLKNLHHVSEELREECF